MRTVREASARHERYGLPERRSDRREEASGRSALAAVKYGAVASVAKRHEAPLGGDYVLRIAVLWRETRVVAREEVRHEQPMLV